MKRKSVCSRLIVGVTLVLLGCRGKDGDPGPSLTGDMVGLVSSYGENGEPESKAGTTVTVDNLTPTVSAQSDANGRFQLTGLKTGTYNLSFTRAGHGTYRRFGIAHVGGDQATYIGNQHIVTSIPTQVVTSFSISPNQNGRTIDFAASLSYSTANPNAIGRVIIYFSKSPAVSSTNYQASEGINGYLFTGRFPTGTFNAYTFTSNGFVTGEVVYAVAYPAPYYTYSYTDPSTGVITTPGLGTPSVVQSFRIP